jgi:hypothetical protein
MVKLVFAASIAAAALIASSFSAQAQNVRSWVASNGSDANACTRAAPCATFGGALAKTNASGIISVVDSGDYGAPPVIDKSITIQSDGIGTASVTNNAASGFVISGSGITVTFRGLELYTDGAVSALSSGIVFANGAALHVENCTIRNYVGTESWGIVFKPSSGTAQLFVSDTVISYNGTASTGGGISISPTSAAGANISLTRVISKNNAVGFKADASATSGFINMTIDGSNATGNVQHGVWAVGGSSGADIFLHNTMINSNAQNGLRAQNSGARIFYSYSTITNNGVGLAPLSGGQLISKGTNNNRGNYVPGSPTSTQSLE